MYIHTTTLTQHGEQDIRAAFPNTSFPVPFVAPEDYAYIFPAPAQYNPVTQAAVADTPVLTDKGHWEQRWIITDKPAEQIAAEAEAARIASVPTFVSMRQAQLELYDAGLLDDVEALIATLPRPYQIDWAKASVVERSNALVEVVRVQQSLTVEYIDNLFIRADKR